MTDYKQYFRGKDVSTEPKQDPATAKPKGSDNADALKPTQEVVRERQEAVGKEKILLPNEAIQFIKAGKDNKVVVSTWDGIDIPKIWGYDPEIKMFTLEIAKHITTNTEQAGPPQWPADNDTMYRKYVEPRVVDETPRADDAKIR